MPNNTIPAETHEKKFKSFFEKDIRLPDPKDPVTTEVALSYFEEYFKLYKDKLYSQMDNMTQHPFYLVLCQSFNSENEQSPNNSDDPKYSTCDEQFAQYLKEVSNKTNKGYYCFIMKFVTLFRECINNVKKGAVDVTKITNDKSEYSQLYAAENAPDLCNDFIVEFMEPNDYYGLDTNELIEAIQHLCYWLYMNNYTTSRLSLL